MILLRINIDQKQGLILYAGATEAARKPVSQFFSRYFEFEKEILENEQSYELVKNHAKVGIDMLM